MSRRASTAVLLFVLVLTAGVGITDAALEGSGDHLALFMVIGAAALLLAFGTYVSNPTFAVRRDLARWVTTRAELTGEPVEQIVDRALDGYRALLLPAPDDAVAPTDGGDGDREVVPTPAATGTAHGD